MSNRVSYLKMLSEHKNNFLSEFVSVKDQNESVGSNKAQHLLMIADDPKNYYAAMEELKEEEGAMNRDHVFSDQYVYSEDKQNKI